MASSTRAIIGYRTGKRHADTTDEFIHDLRGRVIGSPEISTDGLYSYRAAILGAFGKRATHGVINKTYSVTHLAVIEAALKAVPTKPTPTPAQRRRSFRVIQGDLFD